MNFEDSAGGYRLVAEGFGGGWRFSKLITSFHDIYLSISQVKTSFVKITAASRASHNGTNVNGLDLLYSSSTHLRSGLLADKS